MRRMDTAMREHQKDCEGDVIAELHEDHQGQVSLWCIGCETSSLMECDFKEVVTIR